MIIIEDVISMKSHKDTLVIETKSGIDICFRQDEGPNYINISTVINENNDLIITANVDWDSDNMED